MGFPAVWTNEKFRCHQRPENASKNQCQPRKCGGCFFFFLLILNMGNLKMNDLLFYICHPGHLSLEFKVRCISHWLHQSTFSSEGQPVSFVWMYDCTADGPHLDSHTGWPPAAHSNVGAAGMLGWPWCTLKAASLVHCAATSSLQDDWMNNRMMH